MLQEVSLAGLECSVCYKKCALLNQKTQYVSRSVAGLEDSACYKK